MEDIQKTLDERGKTYGSFRLQAERSQLLQGLVQYHSSGNTLLPYQQEALQMICVKLARIMNGDPNYVDSWKDIAGYAQLVVNELEKEVE